jgi:hypothetical protein
LAIVGFTSSLGFGGNGLFGLEGEVICGCVGNLFLVCLVVLKVSLVPDD